MAGIPAGFEDDSDSDGDNFVMYDDDYNEDQFYTPDIKPKNDAAPKARFVSQVNQPVFEFLKNTNVLTEEVNVAVTRNNVEHLKKSLKNGFQVDTVLHSGWTALMCACSNGFHEIVKVLIDEKANVNFEKDLFTPLMAVCYASGQNEDNLVLCAKYLIAAGSKIDAHDRNLMTSLMYATRQGYSKLVKLLCEHGGNVNQQETRGWSALCFGAWKGYVHVVKMLLENGGNPDMTTFDGQRPCDLAFSQGYKTLSELLENYDSSRSDQLHDMTDKMTSLKSVGTSKYVKYGNLELYLHGLELGHLLPKFQEHQLEFPDLLKITEKEMVEIGVKELGVRKKLLNAIRDVHTNEWDMTSLKNTEKLSKLTMLELAAVMANVGNHLACIESSVQFVKQNVERKKDMLVKDDTSNQKVLIEQTREAIRLSCSLKDKVASLDTFLLQIFPNHNRTPVDLIEKPNQSQSGFKRTFLVASVIGVTGLALLTGVKYLKEHVR